MLAILKLAFSFYLKFLWVSLFINLLFLGFSIAFPVAFFYKLILALLILWTYKTVGKGEKLIFYQNLKLSSTGLFSLGFFFDVCLLIIMYLIPGILL